ncbi:MAG: non-heme iron oxygenase ferredoxin subunit [Pseudomonadota bacterium]
MDSNFKPLIHKDNVPEKSAFCGEIDGQAVAVCKVKDEYFAFENQCSHANASFDGGRLKAYRISCPLHGATFDVRSGEATSRPAKLPIKTYPLRVTEDGMLEVAVD